MPYCPKCGLRILEGDARFCPNCGAILPQFKAGERRIAWTGTLLQRAIVFFTIFILCIFVTLVGALTKIDLLKAREMVDEMNKIENILRGTDVGIQLIFGNNLMYTLGMFVPIVGPGLGFYVLYNTGLVISAFSTIYKINPLSTLLLLFIFPHAWMEYTAYALAISESFWLIYAAIKRRFRDELILMSIIVVICNILLLLGALTEIAVIAASY
ncbi:MAG: zinc ribbon domain-containing protein [Candidatus Bathyarchaeia archaeon]|nr:stage II sporulation protein M [Candidatus Bathyarchaeota archaeon]